MEAAGAIAYRPMTAEDVGRVPLDCHGGTEALAARIADLGAAAILAFDGDLHVAQLQFRRHDPELRSPNGIHSPDYWGDFGGRGPELAANTLGVFCYHVGQVAAGDARDPRYQGRGVGVALLDHLLAWAEANGFAAVVAKSVPPHRPVMRFMGGQNPETYRSRGFELAASWVEPDLQAALIERSLVAADSDPSSTARLGMWVRRFRA